MKNIMAALVNGKPGMLEEFEQWYREVHMPQMVDRLPGVTEARRFTRVSVAGMADPAFAHLVVYEIEDGMLEETIDAFLSLRGERVAAAAEGRSSDLAISPAMDPAAVFGFYRVTGNDEVIGSR